jgi:hypothetical protein
MQFVKKMVLTLCSTSVFLIQPIYNNTANADLTIGVFKEFKNGTETQSFGLDSYIGGVGKGYLWANAVLLQSGRQPLFCFKGDMTSHDFLKIASDEIKNVQRYKRVDDETEVELVLLEKLKRMYPCGKKK